MRPTDRAVLKASTRRAIAALVRRDFATTRSYRASFVLDLFFGIMNLVVFYFISRTVVLRAGTLDGAPTYFAFASVGIVLTVVMQAATSGLAARVREEQLTGTLEVLVMQPLTPTQLALGLTGFPYLFGVVRAGFYIAFAALFLNLDLSDSSMLGFLLILVATGVALSAIGVAMGGLVLVFKQGATLGAVVTFGLTLLSGALFPRDLLPGWIQAIGELLPTRFAIDGLRDALFDGTGWHGDLYALTASSAILLPLAILFFSATLKIVRRTGSLSQY